MKRRFERCVRTAGMAVLTGAVLASPLASDDAWAAPPGEVADLAWCPATKNCLSWSAAAGATQYEVHRGGTTDLQGLLDESVDSCAVGSYTATTTGASLDETPAAGAMHWFLVTASNVDGTGGAGPASAGPRLLDSAGDCLGGTGVLINEVDYDQPGIDFGEFVEIYNAGAIDRDLGGLALILVNGQSSEEYLRVDLGEAGTTLPAGSYLVAGTSSVVASLPAGTLSVTFASLSNNVQNGAPDGIALFDTGNLTLLDALSYEGAIVQALFDGVPGTYNLVEGTAATAKDSNSIEGSVARSPNGNDTGDADSDWQFNGVASPGSFNPEP